MALRSWQLPALALAGACLCVNPLSAADQPKGKEIASFGSLQGPTEEAAKAQASAWYARSGGKDQINFDKIWATDRPTLEKVGDTLALGNVEAARILKQARDVNGPAPEGVPALIKDRKVDTYLRANLALVYAKALANRRIFEESQLALSSVKPEDVVDPASYFFTRAVSYRGDLRYPAVAGRRDRFP